MAKRVIGVISEYNPFHAGHARLLARAGADDTVICLMSGFFTQRGEAAIFSPAARARAALLSGADLVLELPFPHSAASARYFAACGVGILSRLGADALLFGSECGDLSLLRRAAARTLEKDFEKEFAARAKREGAAAAHAALIGVRLFANDLLASEYLRASSLLEKPLEPMLLRREGGAYTDDSLNTPYPSAAALRKAIFAGKDVAPYLPESVRAVFKESLENDLYPADVARLAPAMLARLRAAERGGFSAIAECGGGLGARLVRAAKDATDYESLCRAAATKQYTDARIRRALLFILSGVTRADLIAPAAYVRLLGATARGREFLAKQRKDLALRVVTKPSEIRAMGKETARQRQLEEIAAGLYALTLSRPVLPRALAAPPVFL